MVQSSWAQYLCLPSCGGSLLRDVIRRPKSTDWIFVGWIFDSTRLLDCCLSPCHHRPLSTIDACEQSSLLSPNWANVHHLTRSYYFFHFFLFSPGHQRWLSPLNFQFIFNNCNQLHFSFQISGFTVHRLHQIHWKFWLYLQYQLSTRCQCCEDRWWRFGRFRIIISQFCVSNTTE